MERFPLVFGKVHWIPNVCVQSLDVPAFVIYCLASYFWGCLVSFNLSYTVSLIRSKGHGVNFTNVLQAAFMREDPKSAKNTVKSTVFFVLSGSARVDTVMFKFCKRSYQVRSKYMYATLISAITVNSHNYQAWHVMM
jgi:hypothetical protein